MPEADAYVISDDKAQLQFDWVLGQLQATYWAAERSAETMRRAIAGSVCFGAFDPQTGRQVGFARVVTDFATFAWICDVVIDPAHRGRGLGKRLMATIVADPRFATTSLNLATRDAHGLYEQFGFARIEMMRRPKAQPAR